MLLLTGQRRLGALSGPAGHSSQRLLPSLLLLLLLLLLLVSPPQSPMPVDHDGISTAGPTTLRSLTRFSLLFAAAFTPTTAGHLQPQPQPQSQSTIQSDPSFPHHHQQHSHRHQPSQQSRRHLSAGDDQPHRQKQGHRHAHHSQQQHQSPPPYHAPQRQLPHVLPPACHAYSALWAPGSPPAEDLQYWAAVGVTARMADTAVARHAAWPNRTRNALYYAFVAGRVMVLPTNLDLEPFWTHASLHMPYMKLLLYLEETYGATYIPDVDFVITTEDVAPASKQLHVSKLRSSGAAPQLRYGKANSSTDLLIPNFHFGLKKYDTDILNRTAELNASYPWDQKLPVAFGRFSNYGRVIPDRSFPPRLGSDGASLCKRGVCAVRQHFAEWAAQYAPAEQPWTRPGGAAQEEQGRGRTGQSSASSANAGGGTRAAAGGDNDGGGIDSSDSGSRGSSDSSGGDGKSIVSSGSGSGGAKGHAWSIDVSLRGRVPLVSHAAYKYLVHLDGVALSSRLEQLLALNSLVLREESGHYGFYHHLLLPRTHYLPFWGPGATPEELVGVLDWAAENDEQAQSIAAAGQQLARHYLTATARHCYVLWLLQNYARTLQYEPPLPDWAAQMVPLRSFVEEAVLGGGEEGGGGDEEEEEQSGGGKGGERSSVVVGRAQSKVRAALARTYRETDF